MSFELLQMVRDLQARVEALEEQVRVLQAPKKPTLSLPVKAAKAN